MKLNNTKSILVICFLGIITYFQVYKFEFIIDDKLYVSENSIVANGLKDIDKIFLKPTTFGYKPLWNGMENYSSHTPYRPLTLFTYAIDNVLHNNNESIMHLENVILYIFLCCFIFFLLQLLHKNRGNNLLITLAFLCLPIHQEVVATIKSRDELLCIIFFLGSLYSLTLFNQFKRKKYLYSSVLLFSLSLLSKEAAVTFIVLFPLYNKLLFKIENKQNIIVSLYYLIPFVLFLSLRYFISKDVTPGILLIDDNALLSIDNILLRKLNALYLVGIYVLKIFYPYPLLWDYSIGHYSFNTLTATIGFINGIIILITLYWLKSKKKYEYLFGLLFFLITLSITSNIFIEIPSTFADRFAFTPSLAIIFILIPLFHFYQKKIKFFIVSLVVIYTLYNIKTLNYWKNEITINEHSELKSQRSILSKSAILIEKKQYSKALSIINKSIGQGVINSELYYLKGLSLLNLNNFKRAMLSYNKCLNINEYHVKALNDLSRCKFKLGKYDDALKLLKKAETIDPNNFLIIKNLAAMYYNIGLKIKPVKYHKKAKRYLEKGLKIKANDETLMFIKQNIITINK